MSLHNLYSNFENHTIFANEKCSKFFLGKLNITNQNTVNFLKDVGSANFDQRGMELIEEMKRTVKIGEDCFKREWRFKSGDSDEWKWSSYFSVLHICLPIILAIIVCPIMVNKQDSDSDEKLPFFLCLPLVPLTKIYSAVVEFRSHYWSLKYRGDDVWVQCATEVAEWTKIIGNIGRFLEFYLN